MSFYGSLLESDRKLSEKLDNNEYLNPSYAGLKGIILLLISAVFLGFGNSLEPISPLSFLHTFFLIFGYYVLCRRYGYLISFILTVFLEALGSTLGFASLFNSGESFSTSVGYTFGFSIVIWFIVVLIALFPMFIIFHRFPSFYILPFIYPISQTTVFYAIIGPFVGVFPSLANSVLDYSPLRQSSSLLGAAGINFLVILFGSFTAFHVINHKIIDFPRLSYRTLFSTLIILIISSFLIQSTSFYQKDVSSLIKPSLQVSCVFGQNIRNDTTLWNNIWQNTKSRIEAGDDIILWSETAVNVYNDLEENTLINDAKHLVLTKMKSYLGITYLRIDGSNQYNRFALITPDGELAWNYKKAFPVPIIESSVVAGAQVIPTYSSPTLGTLGGAICFDFDHPQYIHQAGLAGVDIMLQPSWTWGALSDRHFEGNALRAIENGFSLFRCSSDGVSGIVNPYGLIWSRLYTGHDPNTPAVFTLPLWQHTATMYTYFGFIFEWLCLIGTFVFLFIAFMPMFVLSKFQYFFSKREAPVQSINLETQLNDML